MEQFPYFVATAIQVVMDHPEKYIIPENLAAINYLWNMNILTEQTNDYSNEDSWIAIGSLSEENEKVFTQIRNNPAYFNESIPGVLTHHGRGFRVPVKPGTRDTLKDFMPLFSLFKLQDVPKEGYMTVEEFYINHTDCFRVVRNPYLKREPKIFEYTNIEEYEKAWKEWANNPYPETPRIRVFDPEKVTKSLEEYLKESGYLGLYDPEEGKVFYNKRLYDGHMKYKDMKNRGRI